MGHFCAKHAEGALVLFAGVSPAKTTVRGTFAGEPVTTERLFSETFGIMHTGHRFESRICSKCDQHATVTIKRNRQPLMEMPATVHAAFVQQVAAAIAAKMLAK